jgi:hypothetical protein
MKKSIDGFSAALPSVSFTTHGVPTIDTAVFHLDPGFQNRKTRCENLKKRTGQARSFDNVLGL